MADPLTYLKYEDLDDSMKIVAHYCGMEVVRDLIRHMSGETITIPAAKRVPGMCARFVQEEFDGTTASVRRMARLLDSSQAHVRNILRGGTTSRTSLQ